MPIKKSAYKNLRKSEARHYKNISTASELKTLTGKFRKSVSGKKIDEAKSLLGLLISKLDRAASKGVIHKNTASRRISRLTKSLAALSKA